MINIAEILITIVAALASTVIAIFTVVRIVTREQKQDAIQTERRFNLMETKQALYEEKHNNLYTDVTEIKQDVTEINKDVKLILTRVQSGK